MQNKTCCARMCAENNVKFGNVLDKDEVAVIQLTYVHVTYACS